MRLAQVAAIAELTDVLPRVLGRNVDVGAFDGALKQRPMAFQPIHVMDAPNIPFRGARRIGGAKRYPSLL
jgi:hypothetical protein